QKDVEPTEVDNIDELIRESRVVIQDDFLVDDDEFEDDTLEEYDDEEIEIIDSDTGSAPPGSGLGSGGSDPKEKRVKEEISGIVIEKELKRTKTNKLKAKFDYSRDNIIFMDSIEQLMMHYLRDWRNTMKGNPEIRELMSPIDCFENRHHKQSGWRNERRWLLQGRKHLLRLRLKLKHLANPSLSTESIVGPPPIDEYAIMTQSLEHQGKLKEHQAEAQHHLDEQQRLLQVLIAQLGNNGLHIKLSPPPPSFQ
ncbi:hypothetical protein PanWU01x14_130020, partial [Parasponia andersonii]